MKSINENLWKEEEIQKLHDAFQNARPYRHIVMDEFLKPEAADQVYENFPSVEQLNKHYKGYNEQKSEGSNFSDFHSSIQNLKEDLSSSEFYKFLEKVTGIEGLFMTDDKLGAGLHQGQNGSFLDVHIDFNIHPEKDVHRRLNLLIYMNKEWKESYGGALEMWNEDVTKCERMVYPAFNRAVIFETNEISYHGYSRINVPEDVTRKSFYAYFYTEKRDDGVEYHDTIFKARPEESKVKRLTTDVKERLKNFAKRQVKNIKG